MLARCNPNARRQARHRNHRRSLPRWCSGSGTFVTRVEQTGSWSGSYPEGRWFKSIPRNFSVHLALEEGGNGARLNNQPGLLVEPDVGEPSVSFFEAEAVQRHVLRRNFSDGAPTDRTGQQSVVSA